MVDASKLHDEAPSPFAPKTFTPTSGSVNQKTATAVQKVLDTVHGISEKEPEKVSQGGGLFGGLSTASTTTTTSGASGGTGLFGSVSSGSEKSGLFQVKKEVTKTQSIASSNATSGGFNFGTPKKDAKAEIPKPSLFGSSAPSSGDGGAGGIFGKKPEAKPAVSEVEKAPEKKTSIFAKPSGGSTGGIFGSSAPSGGGIFGSAPSKPSENPFASKAPSTPKANPFGSKSSGVNPFGSSSSGGASSGGLFGSTSTKTPVKEYKFNEEKESEDENDQTEDEVSGDEEEEDSAEDQSADETLIPNRQSEEPPVETKVGFKLYSRKMILSYLAKIHI